MQRTDGSLWTAGRHGQTVASCHLAQGDSNDCGPYVVSMVINFWHGSVLVKPDDMVRAMNRPRLSVGLPPLIVRRIPNWATFPWGITDVLHAHDIPARWRLRAAEDDLHRALREDRVIMPIFGEPLRRQGWRFTGWSHVAILAGWDPEQRTYWFVDSARSTAPTSRPRNEFLAYWENMGRILIETLKH